jgi:hypothetical protein
VNSESANPNKNNDENLEWQLSELVDLIAAEVDRAADTLSLKSYARGASFAVKKLSLDLEVKVRRTADGKLLFRTVSDDKTSSTVLKLANRSMAVFLSRVSALANWKICRKSPLRK